MIKISRSIKSTLMFSVSILFFSIAANAEPSAAGSVVFTIGKVTAVSGNGQERLLKKRDEVYSGETITTSDKSQAQLRMIDNAFVSVKPDSIFKIDQYEMAGKSGDTDASEIEIIKGGFRAITGVIGKRNRNAYKVKTPVATLGVRGTDYVVMLCASDCAQRNENGNASENAPTNGLYVGVIDGAVRLANSIGSIQLDRNQFGFIDSISGLATTLPEPPSFLLFDRTAMPTKELREFRRLLGSQIVAASQQREERPSRDQSREPTAPGNDSLRGRDGPTDAGGGRGAVGANNLPGISSLAGKAGSFLSAQNLNKFDVSLSDFVDASQLNAISNSTYITGVEQNIGNLAQNVDLSGGPRLPDDLPLSSGTKLPSLPDVGPNPDPITNPPTFSDYQQIVTPKPMRDFAFVAGTPGLASGITPWAGKLDENQSVFDQANQPIQFGFSENGSNYIVKANTLDVRDFGYDQNSDIWWGRWVAGNVDVSKDGASAAETIDKNAMHWVMAGLKHNVTLPLQGTASYTLYQNTSPTDNFGKTGTLGSVDLTANFTAQTVDAQIKLDINNQTWNGDLKNAPITGTSFASDATNKLNVTVTTTSGTVNQNTSGALSGVFAGPSSVSGAPQSAGVVYRMDAPIANASGSNTSTTTTVSGAAVLQVKP